MNLKPQFHLAPCAPGLFILLSLVSVVTVGLHDQRLNRLHSILVRAVVLIQLFLHMSVGIHPLHCSMCLECALEKPSVQVTAVASDFAEMDNFLDI